MIICDKKTQLITDFGDCDLNELDTLIKDYVLNGKLTKKVSDFYEEWVVASGTYIKPGTDLIMMSMVFPLKFYISIRYIN